MTKEQLADMVAEMRGLQNLAKLWPDKYKFQCIRQEEIVDLEIKKIRSGN